MATSEVTKPTFVTSRDLTNGAATTGAWVLTAEERNAKLITVVATRYGYLNCVSFHPQANANSENTMPGQQANIKFKYENSTYTFTLVSSGGVFLQLIAIG